MQQPTSFVLNHPYTREQVRESVGNPGRGGAWDTGYRLYRGEFFLFCGVGTPGRTGHDYNNYWDGERLHWEAKGQTNIEQPLIRRLLGGRYPIHIFTREDEKSAFRYEGLGRALEASATTPVKVVWALDADMVRPMSGHQVADTLADLGFDVEAPKVKSQRATSADITVYIKQESDSFVLVIDPKYEPRVRELAAIAGVRRPMPAGAYVHNSSFRSFAQRLNHGAEKLPFGIDFDVDTPEALSAFIEALRSPAQLPKPMIVTDVHQQDPRTESESVRAARLGQSKFRNDLMARWERQCSLTGLPITELLRASHIKPWRDSTPKERLDPNNGLLLAIHVDGLFDRGLITFDDDGRLIPSPVIDISMLELLGLTGLRISGLNDENRRYLAIHRTSYFKAPQTDRATVDPEPSLARA